MRRSRRRRPILESLEPLTLLNAAAVPVVHALVHVPHRGMRLTLSGQVSGTWTTLPAVPDLGTEQILTGSGTVGPLKAVGAKATLQLTGFIAQGEATGLLRITNRLGSVRVQLTGPMQPGFSSPPSTLSYTITGGTGRYAGATGRGTIALVESPGQTSNSSAAPSFTMTFHP